MQRKDSTQAQHTPTPWRFVPWHIEEGPSAVKAPGGWYVCTTASDANAEFIVRAVNSHAALVEALSDAVDVLDWIHNKHSEVAGFATVEAVKKARTALAAAKVTK